jgi:xanthine dehydrogenase/oxidase
MAQIAADVFKIPVSQVHISETATDKVPNTPPTAASAGSDLNGMAVLDACNQIMERLIPYREEQPNKPLKVYADLAYKDRVNLSANGFYKTPDLSYDWSTNSGRMFNYFTFGVAVSEVEMDSLTGDFQIIRSDILMDLGTSMNPGVDIGQIEGAFVQGAGWSTIEETVFFPNGHLFTRGPGNYKIPGFTDIPIEFNVKLLSECKNVRAVHSSKAVGEPPLFLGSSVYFALRDAIKSHRESQGLGTGYFRLDAPATPERIRMACEDRFTKLSRSIARKDGEKDWCIPV